jgi:hypothetical protein
MLTRSGWMIKKIRNVAATTVVAIALASPAFAGPITASATGTTGVTTATLAAAPGQTTYICGLSIRANATAAITGNATVTGTISGTLNFSQFVNATGAEPGKLEMPFIPCIPGSGLNTAIAVNSIASGTAGVVSVTAWGYYQ